MNRQRYLDLERHEACLLTENEMEEGWHFCESFDFMLIGPGMQELRCCDCPCAAEAKKEVVREIWIKKLERRLKVKSKQDTEVNSITFQHKILESDFNSEPKWEKH